MVLDPVALYDPSGYWFAAFLFQRGLGLVYLIAFLVAYHQFVPLVGENGILPLARYVNLVDFKERPSLFHYYPRDRVIRLAAGTGIVLSILAVTGIPGLFGTLPSMLVWLLLWVMYLSFVNVGQIFYGYGWESLLLEAGFLAIFIGGFATAAPFLLIMLIRWVLFRVMFGAGLIKIRGDQCWRDLTCLEYHYETQPIPNPMSWFAHHTPRWFHKIEVLGNHVVELLVPALLFAPQPVAMIAGLVTIGFQSWLMVTGNFSWLNFLTAVLAISTIPDWAFQTVLPFAVPAVQPLHPAHQYVVYGLVVLVAVKSYNPAKNMLSSRQIMNTSFDPLHLVNTYGAFGSITKDRYELVIQGTSAEEPDKDDWKTYEFKGKPTDVSRRPPQWAPYHLRLDWQLWFAAMTPFPRRDWFHRFIEKLLENDDAVLSLLQHNPFPDNPPKQIRVQRYIYEYTTPEERRETGNWWTREYVGDYLGPVALDDR